MFFEVIDLPVVFAVTPVVGALAFQRIWSSRRDRAELQSEANRAAAAQREAMQVIHEALVATERAERARDEFLDRMSHELRTPLNAVIGFSRLLEANRAGNQRPEDLHLLERVRANGEQLLRLVEDVLEQARIARGNLAILPGPTDVAGHVRSVVERHLGHATKKGLQLVAVVPDGPMLLPLDGRRFEEVLRHLVENAIKFTAHGSVRVELTNDETGRPARLVIADTGVGIAADRFEDVFQPFTQVEGSRHRRYGGAGLGLPLARQLCMAMGCQLGVESDVGKGSRFIIRFPGQA